MCISVSGLPQHHQLIAINAVSTASEPVWASSTSAISSCVMTTSASLIWWYPISLSPLRRKRSPLQSNNRPPLMPVKALKPRLQLRFLSQSHPIQQRLSFQIHCTSLSLFRSPVLSVFLHPLRALGSTTITTWASQSVKGEFFSFQEDETPNASPVRSSLFLSLCDYRSHFWARKCVSVWFPHHKH